MIPFLSLPMALILHIETATTASSVALSANGILLAAAERNEKNLHASIITELINEVIVQAGVKLADIDAISVSKGPGSYTGLRIGVATAKGLCFALDKPLIAINTLEAMSAGVLSRLHKISHPIITYNLFGLRPLIDARRMEVYTAQFDQSGNLTESTNALILDQSTFLEQLAIMPLLFFGDGAEKIYELYQSHTNAYFMSDFLNSATFQITLANERFNASAFEDLRLFEPFYLKEFFNTQIAAGSNKIK